VRCEEVPGVGAPPGDRGDRDKVSPSRSSAERISGDSSQRLDPGDLARYDWEVGDKDWLPGRMITSDETRHPSGLIRR
jgi:hypothetical protein